MTGCTQETQKKIDKLAALLFARMNPKCDRGGCAEHSGHEFCSVDAAWDEAYQQAEDKILEEGGS